MTTAIYFNEMPTQQNSERQKIAQVTEMAKPRQLT